jgi:uncharacterized protein with FMN-binding domain
MAPGAQKKIANSLVTLSSAAILAVYAAGYIKTKAAAEQLDAADLGRRPQMPAPATAGEDATPPPIEPTAPPVTPTGALSPAVVAKAPGSKDPGLRKAESKTAKEDSGLKKDALSPGSEDPGLRKASSEPAKPTAEAPPAAAPATPPATTPPEPPATPALLMPKESYKDGTYLGWGTSRHGDIQASVTVTDGRIVAASIAQCWTRYSCSWVAHLPPQVIARQSPEVDYVSGATQSANAFYWAVIDALKKAK